MRLEEQILLAVVLDLLLGDPRWMPHPVKYMGRFAMWLEAPLRRSIGNPRIAGVVAVTLVVVGTALVTAGLIHAGGMVHPLLGDLMAVFFIYAGIAARDMVQHSFEVYQALAKGTLAEARHRVAMICGRDTESLDQEAIARATVESVAENMVDGVIAPLFFVVLGGPVVLMAYKAASTLDSTFGYKNEQYLEFGWASARLDDVLNFVPARLAAILTPVAAALLGQRPSCAWASFVRDRAKHPSPNAGQAEAAVAGALGIQLGGLSFYGGVPSHKPTLGDPLVPAEREHILQANALLMTTSGLGLAVFLTVRLVAVHCFGAV
jgi:adenosylcobinamide-phosphate synthase